jgi:hypothetical protein
MRTGFPAALGAAFALATSASAQEAERLPGQYRSLVFLDVVATRGLECGLLRPWQAAALEAQVGDAVRGWSEAHRTQRSADADAQARTTACDDEAMTVWIDGGRRGMESEMLSHYIVAYAALATMSPQPALFQELSTADDHEAARAAIAAKITELDRAGASAEGGVPWPDFVARTRAAVQEMARAYDAGEVPARASREQAEGWIRDSVRVSELWLADAER